MNKRPYHVDDVRTWQSFQWESLPTVPNDWRVERGVGKIILLQASQRSTAQSAGLATRKAPALSSLLISF